MPNKIIELGIKDKSSYEDIVTALVDKSFGGLADSVGEIISRPEKDLTFDNKVALLTAFFEKDMAESLLFSKSDDFLNGSNDKYFFEHLCTKIERNMTLIESQKNKLTNLLTDHYSKRKLNINPNLPRPSGLAYLKTLPKTNTPTFKEILQKQSDLKKITDADRKETSKTKTTPVKDAGEFKDEPVVEGNVSVNPTDKNAYDSNLKVEDVLDSFIKTRTSIFRASKEAADQRREDANLWKLLTEVTDFKGVNDFDSAATEAIAPKTSDPEILERAYYAKGFDSLKNWFEHVADDVKKTAEEKRIEVFEKLLNGLVEVEKENLNLSNSEDISSSIDSVLNFIDKIQKNNYVNSEKITKAKNDVFEKLLDGLVEVAKSGSEGNTVSNDYVFHFIDEYSEKAGISAENVEALKKDVAEKLNDALE